MIEIFTMRKLICCLMLLAGMIVPAFGGENFIAQGEGVRAEYLKAAEAARVNIAVYWMGSPLRGDWYKPIPLRVGSEGTGIPASGSTTMKFDKGEVYGWTMRVSGSRTAIIQSVIPHEVQHTIIASITRKPTPRWLDEGMATMLESPVEQATTRRSAIRYMDHAHSLFHHFDDMRYPVGGNENIIAVYSTGFTFVEWLVEQKGKDTLWRFAIDTRKPSEKFQEFYGVSVSAAWGRWRTWLRDRDVSSRTSMQAWVATYAPPPQIVSADKPNLYVFKNSALAFCLGCYNFDTAYSGNSRFRAALQSRYNIVYVDTNTTNGAAHARRLRVTSVPSFCPSNSSSHVEGFEGMTWLDNQLKGLPVIADQQFVAPPPPVEERSPDIPRTVVTPARTRTTPATPSLIPVPEPVSRPLVHTTNTTGCRCAACFRTAFARIQALETRLAQLDRTAGPAGRNGTDGTNGSNGAAGRGIKTTRVHEGNLQVQYTDSNSWVTVGPVVGPVGPQGPAGKGGRTILSARVKNGNLEFRYSDSPNYVAVGPVQGPPGTPGRGVESVRITANGQLELKYTDGDNWFALGPVRSMGDISELERRVTALEPLLHREVRLYVNGKLADSLTGDEALKPGEPIPIYAVPRSGAAGGASN